MLEPVKASIYLKGWNCKTNACLLICKATKDPSLLYQLLKQGTKKLKMTFATIYRIPKKRQEFNYEITCDNEEDDQLYKY